MIKNYILKNNVNILNIILIVLLINKHKDLSNLCLSLENSMIDLDILIIYNLLNFMIA
jgi:hypothetical protein